MKRRILSLFLCLVLVVSALSGCTGLSKLQANDAGVYEIHSSEDLLIAAKNPEKSYILMADLDMASVQWTPIENFTGTFDGNGKTISNLTVSATAEESVNLGLFGSIAEAGQVKNLHLQDITIQAADTGAQNIGAIAGVVSGKIENCTATGVVNDTRESADGQQISVGALAGKAEAAAVVTGGNTVSVTDNANVYTTEGLAANVKLFVADSQQVSRGLVGTAAAGSTVSGLWRDSFYSSERLSESLQQRQKKVTDYMYNTGTIAWTTPAVLTHKGNYSIHNQTFVPGETYYGIPYDHTAGSYERFLFALDENNQVEDWVADNYAMSVWGGGGINSLGFTTYMGSDCSSAVVWAWTQVSPNQVQDIDGVYQGGAYGGFSGTLFPNKDTQEKRGIYPVGQWTGATYCDELAAYEVGDCNSTYDICQMNGLETMCEAYGISRKGDGLLYGEPGGHVRLIAEDPVVIRDAEGVIDPDMSYLLAHEQGDGLYNNKYEGTNSSWRINYRYTFRVLFQGSSKSGKEKSLEGGSGKGYIPITVRALRDEVAPVPVIYVHPEGQKTKPITSPMEGVFGSNFRIQSVTVIIKDSTGKEVYNKEVFDCFEGNTLKLRGANITADLNYYHKDAMEGLPKGDYTFTVKALLSDGSIHTVVEDQAYTH